MTWITRLRLAALVVVAACGAASGAWIVGTSAAPSTPATAGIHRPAPLEVPVRPGLVLGQRAARLAPRWVGTPYRYGGTSPSGFDCSGFTRFVYGKLGVDLPHNAAAQYALGRPIARARLRPGDLLFFHGLGHVGIYVGAGRMVHAPQSGRRVEIVRLSGHYGERLVGARRVVAT